VVPYGKSEIVFPRDFFDSSGVHDVTSDADYSCGVRFDEHSLLHGLGTLFEQVSLRFAHAWKELQENGLEPLSPNEIRPAL
jgi:hypothetical protein